jgi:NAD(P)-dependent dehydrogenase (short-subunit alcohol dehydrogenase family)
MKTGSPYPLGASVTATGVNFSVFSFHATRAELLLFDTEDATQPSRIIDLVPETSRTSHYWHVHLPGINKGGLNAITLSLANEYAKDKIRFNAVAPGVVDTRLHDGISKDFLKTRNPMATISDPKDIAEAVIFLAEARHITGEVLHVDDGAHVGRW